MFELGENLTKFMQLGIGVVGLATLVIIFISYNVNLVHGEVERRAYVLGDYLLSSECLALVDSSNNVVKSMFTEAKLIAIDGSTNPACISYSEGRAEVKLIDSSDSWEFVLGPSDRDINKSFIVAVRMNDGSIKPAHITVVI